MVNRTPNYGIDSANEAERLVWTRVFVAIGALAVVAGSVILFMNDDMRGSEPSMPAVPSSVDISIEP
jgi:hypothetical protein